MTTEPGLEDHLKPDQPCLSSAEDNPRLEPVVATRNISKSPAMSSSFTHFSPLTTRSRKITSPSSSFPYSPVSNGFSVSNSDLSDLTTPGSTPLLDRKRTVSGCQDSVSTSTMSRSSSTLSLCSNLSQVTTSPLSPVERLLKHLREKLVGYLFSGWYTERRYVDPIDRYRDVILVDDVEAVVLKQVKYAIRKCRKIFDKNSFLGLSYVEDQCKMFVNLGGGLEITHPFGHYWLQIKSVHFITNLGLIFELRVVRQFVGSDSLACWRCKAREASGDETPVKIDSITGAVVDLQSRLVTMSSDVMTDLWRPREVWAQVSPHLNVQNLGQLGKLLMVLVFALLTGLVAGLKQASNFSLKLLHELANLVDRSTPFALGALAMFTKMVGGAYLLLAMIWRDAVKKQPVGPPQPGRPQVSLAAPAGGTGGAGAGYQVSPPHLSRRTSARPDPGAAMDKMYSQDRNW